MVEDKKLIDKPYSVRFVDGGIIKTEDMDNGNAPVDKMILTFSKIDDVAGADGNPRKCEL
jgi:hypothetical protein